MVQPNKLQNNSFLDLSTSIHSATVVNLQDDQKPQLPPAEVVPVVAPPSLKEVEQAVQEASEQVESRGAEEVLKELLERVVEAALGQVDGAGEVKAVEGPVQEVVEEEEGEATADVEAKVSGPVEEKEDEGLGLKAEYAGGEERELAGEVMFEHVAEEDEGDTAAGSVAETTTGVGTGGREADGVEVSSESLYAGTRQGDAEATLDVIAEEAGMEDNNEQVVVVSEEKGAADTSAQETEETLAMVEAAGDENAEKETVEKSYPGLAVSDAERLADALGREELLEGKTQVDESERGMTALASDNYGSQITQTAAGEQAEEGDEVAKGNERPEEGDKGGHLGAEGRAAEVVETEGTDVGEAAAGEEDGESEIKEESAASENDGGEEQVGEGEQATLETSHGRHSDDQGEIRVCRVGKVLKM